RLQGEEVFVWVPLHHTGVVADLLNAGGVARGRRLDRERGIRDGVAVRSAAQRVDPGDLEAEVACIEREFDRGADRVDLTYPPGGVLRDRWRCGPGGGCSNVGTSGGRWGEGQGGGHRCYGGRRHELAKRRHRSSFGDYDAPQHLSCAVLRHRRIDHL